MTWYWIVVAVAIIIICILAYVIKHLVNKDSSTDASILLISAGVSLILSAFPGIKEILVAIVASLFKIKVEPATDNVAVICGFALIGIGIYYVYLIKDRIFVLNMFGVFTQPEISEAAHIKELKLADFKVKESIIDFVDIFQNGNMSTEKNSIIVNKIKKQCLAFRNRSGDTKSCFTGMAPIPYTILAGNYLSGGTIKRYFEYIGSTQKFTELSRKKCFEKYPKLAVKYQNQLNVDSKDILVAVSISFPVQDNDIKQFDADVIRIGLEEPRNNIITRIDQLEEYCDEIVTEIERARTKYPNLKTVHLLASIPSCVSVRLGDQFRLRSNRLPRVISYHFMNSNTPKYPFGVVVADSTEKGYGQLVLCSDQGDSRCTIHQNSLRSS